MITRIGVSHYRQIAGGQKIELVHPSQENQEPTAAYAAGLWGANSIGKSALVDALDWLQAATSSRHPNWWPPVPRSATARPTTVSVDILVEQQLYQYSLATDEQRIVHESLCIDDTDDQKQPDNMVFERGTAGVKLGKKLRARAPDQELLGRLEVDPSSTMLLVRIPAEVEHGIRRKWNVDSGGSGTSIPGSGTRIPGSGTSIPAEVEPRFRGS